MIKKDSILGLCNWKDDYCHLQRGGKTRGKSYFVCFLFLSF